MPKKASGASNTALSADAVRVIEIMRKTRRVPHGPGDDTEDTFWLLCDDGYAHRFVEGETMLTLERTDG